MEYLALIPLAIIFFLTGLFWGEREKANLQDEVEILKTLNEAMSKGIELRDAHINQLKKYAKHLN